MIFQVVQQLYRTGIPEVHLFWREGLRLVLANPLICQKYFLEENKERGNGPVTSPTEGGSGGHPSPAFTRTAITDYGCRLKKYPHTKITFELFQQVYRTGIPEKHLFLCFFARDRFPPHSVWLGAPSSPSKGIVVT